MKIDTCIIIKNEENNIEPLVHQLAMFSDEIHITDTGSTDSTLEILEKLKETYPNLFIHHFEWVMDFSKAKNYSLTCYECNADYQFWCDADDQLNDTLIQTLQEFRDSKDKDANIYYIHYQYFDGDTNPHLRTSLLKTNSDIQWHDPIHEYVALQEDYKLDTDFFDNGSLIIHKRVHGHTMRNLEIFFNMEKTKYEFTGRNRYYYGQELLGFGLNDSAANQFIKCIDFNNGDLLDKFNSIIKLFSIDKNLFLENAYKLLKIGLIRKDILYHLGEVYLADKNWIIAKMYYEATVNYPEPAALYTFLYDHNTNVNAYLQLNYIAYYYEHDINKTIMYNNKVLELDPENVAAKNNLKILQEHTTES